jgi:hypothetical protein
MRVGRRQTRWLTRTCKQGLGPELGTEDQGASRVRPCQPAAEER